MLFLEFCKVKQQQHGLQQDIQKDHGIPPQLLNDQGPLVATLALCGGKMQTISVTVAVDASALVSPPCNELIGVLVTAKYIVIGVNLVIEPEVCFEIVKTIRLIPSVPAVAPKAQRDADASRIGFNVHSYISLQTVNAVNTVNIVRYMAIIAPAPAQVKRM